MILPARERTVTGVIRRALVLCLLLTNAVTAAAAPDQSQADGQELLTVEQSRWGEIRTSPGTDWSG